MDEKVAERLDTWWASLDEAAQNELMDNPNALLSEAAAGSLGKDLLLVTRWGEGEWEAQIGDHVRAYIDRRARIRAREAGSQVSNAPSTCRTWWSDADQSATRVAGSQS
jgi:hypothetical protein